MWDIIEGRTAASGGILIAFCFEILAFYFEGASSWRYHNTDPEDNSWAGKVRACFDLCQWEVSVIEVQKCSKDIDGHE